MLIVCDLDGTLVDSGRDLAASGNALLASYGAPPLEDEAVIGMVGEGAATLVARLLKARQVPAAPDEALARFLALYDARLLDHTRPYPGIPEALTTLTSMAARLAVLTNKPAGATERILAGLDLRRFFEWVIGGDDAARAQARAGRAAVADGRGRRRRGRHVDARRFGDRPRDGEKRAARASASLATASGSRGVPRRCSRATSCSSIRRTRSHGSSRPFAPAPVEP